MLLRRQGRGRLFRREGGLLKEGGRRGGCLRLSLLVRRTWGGTLLEEGGWLLEKVGRILKNPVEVRKEFDTPSPPTLHTIAGTPCRATRVAADFLDFIAFCRCSSGCRATPPKNFGVAPFPPRFLGAVAPKFGSEKVSRYTGVSQVQLRVSRYTVQLRTVTPLNDPLCVSLSLSDIPSWPKLLQNNSLKQLFL